MGTVEGCVGALFRSSMKELGRINRIESDIFEEFFFKVGSD